MTRHGDDQQGVKGVEIGFRLAQVLAEGQGPMALRELAKAAQLSPSTTHRYLVSLCRAGLVEQDRADGRYDLGKGALTLGLAALARLDEYREADKTIHELRQETGLPVSVIAWGSHGPTVIRRLQPVRPIIATTRIGSVVSVSTSAAGRLFAAFLPEDVVEPFVDAEFSGELPPTSMGRPITRKEFKRIVTEVRKQRFASVRGDFLTGFDAASVPIFDQNGTINMTISLLAPGRTADFSFDGKFATILKEAAQSLSERLGFRGSIASD